MGGIGMNGARLLHALLALLALAGIAFSFAAGPSVPTTALLRPVRFFSFFTILTNLLVALAAIGAALPPAHPWRAIAARPGLRAAVALHILVVALIFHLLLSDMVRPGFSGWIGNMLVHQLVPAGWLLCWLGFGAHGGIDRGAPLRWLAYPLLYTAWVLVHGALGGWYPYPFMNVAALGYPLVLRNVALIGLAFLGLGYALRWVDGRLERRG